MAIWRAGSNDSNGCLLAPYGTAPNVLRDHLVDARIVICLRRGVRVAEHAINPAHLMGLVPRVQLRQPSELLGRRERGPHRLGQRDDRDVSGLRVPHLRLVERNELRRARDSARIPVLQKRFADVVSCHDEPRVRNLDKDA